MTAQANVREWRAQGFEVKLVPDSHLPQVENIWALAFGDNWIPRFSRRGIDRIYGAFKDGDVHAVVGVVDFDMHFNGSVVPAGGIAAVATAPGQRYQNLINILLAEAVKEMHDRKVPLSVLYPFSYPFYERMGWACTHKQHTLRVELGHLKKIARNGDARRYRMLPVDGCAAILPLQHRFAQQFNASIKRTDLMNEQVVDGPGKFRQIFIHDDGYMIWDMRRSAAGELKVQEFTYLTEQAFLDGLALMAQMDAQFETAMWFDWQYEHILKHSVPYPRPRIEVLLGMMSRVVHLQSFEEIVGLKLPYPDIYDPLGVTCENMRGTISTGQLVQEALGFFREANSQFPPGLYRSGGSKPVFTREQF